MKILLVYPESPSSFFSYKEILSLIRKKSVEPPLGLITAAALLPGEWQIKLVDQNVSVLSSQQIKWADYVFLGGMSIHRESFRKVVKRCNQLGVPVVAGGPLVTFEHEKFPGVSHFLLGEAENTIPSFLSDLQKGQLRRIYRSAAYPDISGSPVPRWDLLEMKKYASMSLQFSRGCPHDCEFCCITRLNGRLPRTKKTDQFINELEQLKKLKWRGDVFIVDDNFIGNRREVKQNLLPELVNWSRKNRFPFDFTTETTISLADDPELVKLMVDSGFSSVFVGIETPNEASLAECGKNHNLNRDLMSSVKSLHKSGLMVSGGFIVGFDSDTPDVFLQQKNFIQKSGIVTAMVGILKAAPGTRLFARLKKEKRLLHTTSDNNVDGSVNFIPGMSHNLLVRGYKELVSSLYSPRLYYQRVKELLSQYRPPTRRFRLPSPEKILTLIRTAWKLGVREKGKLYFWKMVALGMFRYPRRFETLITLAVVGFHFRRVALAV